MSLHFSRLQATAPEIHTGDLLDLHTTIPKQAVLSNPPSPLPVVGNLFGQAAVPIPQSGNVPGTPPAGQLKLDDKHTGEDIVDWPDNTSDSVRNALRSWRSFSNTRTLKPRGHEADEIGNSNPIDTSRRRSNLLVNMNDGMLGSAPTDNMGSPIPTETPRRRLTHTVDFWGRQYQLYGTTDHSYRVQLIRNEGFNRNAPEPKHPPANNYYFQSQTNRIVRVGTNATLTQGCTAENMPLR